MPSPSQNGSSPDTTSPRHPARGALIAIGGAEDKVGDRAVLRHVIERAGGKKAKIAVFPTASSIPQELVQSLRHQRAIGVMMAPGDRKDVAIREIGRIAARAFDVIIAQEDSNRRGRPPGEVARLLREGAVEGGVAPDKCHELLTEREAIGLGLGMARPGDLLVVFADDVTASWKQIIYWGKPEASIATEPSQA